MRYTLWSRGRLVGHTDLDIHTVSANMRQGFIDPTDEGRPLLRDATGVWRVMAEERRERRARGGERAPGDTDRFMEACSRREALDLELRDENGQAFECEFMRVYDLFDIDNGIVDDMSDDVMPDDDMSDTEEEQDAEIEAFVAELSEERDSEQMFHSSWPPAPETDERWDTMQYHLQVFLKGAMEVGDEP